MNSESSVFSFDLNESLYFERGQEVAEIRGISLDPNISIQSFNEYISIRGVVELHGQYERVPFPEIDSHHPESFIDNDYSHRYIERVVDVDELMSEFSHRFPVEISVPSDRVDSLDDVTVQITSFDYELPEASRLNLISTIEIHGINDQSETNLNEVAGEVTEEEEFAKQELKNRQENEDALDDTLDGEDNHSTDTNNIDETFEFDIKMKDESEDERESVEDSEPDELEPSVDQSEDNEETTPAEAEEKDDEGNRWGWKKKKSQTLAEFFEHDLETSSSISSSESLTSFASPSVSSDFSSSNLDEESSSDDKTDLRYLTGMFREDEETYTKMRLYIVQKQDTLDTIAERYETTSMHIANQNSLSDDSLSEGQLLYIPYKKKS